MPPARLLLAPLVLLLLAPLADAQTPRSWWRPNMGRSNLRNPPSSGHGHGGHHGHHHGYSPGLGYGYPGYGYYPYFGGFYSSSYYYSSPFGGSFYSGTYAPGYYAPWGTPGYGPIISSPQLDPDRLDPARLGAAAPLDQARSEAEARWRDALNLNPQKPAVRPLKVSTTIQRLKGQQDRLRGDQFFRGNKFPQALEQYKEAVSHAEDDADNQFALAAAYFAIGRFPESVRHLKRTLQADPTWPHTGRRLRDMYHDDAQVTFNAHLLRLSRWVEDDVRDPDRLFLIGALIFAEDPDKASVFLETSARFSGSTAYVDPFLHPAAEVTADGLPAVPEPPQPGVERDVPAAGDAPNDGNTLPPPPPTAAPEAAAEPDAFEPRALDFTLPRHGRGYVPPQPGPKLPESAVPPAPADPAAQAVDGPRFPVLGN